MKSERPPEKRDFPKQWHLPTQHFLNPILGPQTTLLNEKGILHTTCIQPEYSWNACTQEKAQSSPLVCTSPNRKERKNTVMFSVLQATAKLHLHCRQEKQKRDPQDKSVRNLQRLPLGVPCQSTHSSSASCIAFARFIVKSTPLVTFTHSLCSFLGREQEEASTACSKRRELPLTYTVKEQGQPPPTPYNNKDCLIQIT